MIRPKSPKQTESLFSSHIHSLLSRASNKKLQGTSVTSQLTCFFLKFVSFSQTKLKLTPAYQEL